MSNNNISLHGVRDYAITKRGIPVDTPYGDLRDLEQLVKKMDAIRNGSSTENCSCHGNEVPSKYGESRTICSGHSFPYDSGNLSVGHFNDVVTNFKECSCDSFVKMYCDCNTQRIICPCNSQY